MHADKCAALHAGRCAAPHAGRQNHVAIGLFEAIAKSEALLANWHSHVANGPIEIYFVVHKASNRHDPARRTSITKAKRLAQASTKRVALQPNKPKKVFN